MLKPRVWYAALLALSCTACSRCGEFEVVDAAELEPYPHLAEPGPRGLPELAPERLTPSLAGRASRLLGQSARSDDETQAQRLAANALHRTDRPQPYYELGGRAQGAAGVLSGKVAVLNILLLPLEEPVSIREATHARATAEAARRYLTLQAGLRGVTLELTQLWWEVTTDLTPKSIPVTRAEAGNDIRDLDAAHEQILSAITRATGVDLAEVVRRLRRGGYSAVALMVWFAHDCSANICFASPLDRPGIELAVVGYEPSWEGFRAYVHELLHLFGAEDLYYLTSSSPEDDGDPMRDRSLVAIRDMTAYAIGWTDHAPARPYLQP